MKMKMTPLERKWVWYDVGNSAFTLLVSTLLPIFFNTIAESGGASDSDYVVYWSYATSIATVVVAVLGPIFGSLSDLRGMRRKIFSVAVLVGALGCVALGFMQHWMWFLVLFVFAKSAYQLSLVVYDSMLCDVTTRERMDEVSSRGYAWGYIGSCIPFVLTIAVYVMYYMFELISLQVCMIIVFLIVAVWWVACTLPLWRGYEQRQFVEPAGHPVRVGLRSLGHTFKEIARDKRICLATTYGTSLGLDTVSLVIALLVTQVVAFPAAILLGMLSRRVKPQYLIIACIVAYFFITVYAIFLDQEYEFWILAVCVGLFQGTIQAMSRSYFAKIIPGEKASEYFGIYDIFGKGASFMGTFLVGTVTALCAPYFDSLAEQGIHTAFTAQSIGVAALAVMFVIGLVLFILAIRCKAPAAGEGGSGSPAAEVQVPAQENAEEVPAQGGVAPAAEEAEKTE